MQWRHYDRNLDDRIDRADFAYFDEGGIMGVKGHGKVEHGKDRPGKGESGGSAMQHEESDSGSRSYSGGNRRRSTRAGQAPGQPFFVELAHARVHASVTVEETPDLSYPV